MRLMQGSSKGRSAGAQDSPSWHHNICLPTGLFMSMYQAMHIAVPLLLLRHWAALNAQEGTALRTSCCSVFALPVVVFTVTITCSCF